MILVRFILLKIWTEWDISSYILCHFSTHNHFWSRAASRYGSDQMMRLRLRNTALLALDKHSIRLFDPDSDKGGAKTPKMMEKEVPVADDLFNNKKIFIGAGHAT
jgi:hypothetical protein